jgi:hypothetical protein
MENRKTRIIKNRERYITSLYHRTTIYIKLI